jgi:hypothetical protein
LWEGDDILIAATSVSMEEVGEDRGGSAVGEECE